MNLYQELDRLTEPPAKASTVRTLSPEEVAGLQAANAITPVNRIKASSFRHRLVLPPSRRRYDR